MTKTAYVFPGQGSQSIGMLADFELQHPLITETFAEASAAVSYDLWQLIQQGPEEKLNQTEHTQVAMLTADVAIFRLLNQHIITQPEFMAGHSLGEYPALVCADALSLTDAVRLVAHRGRIMQKAIPLGAGSMAALVGLSDEQVIQLCAQASENEELVAPANYNAIGQVVVAGHTPAVERVIALAEEAEARLAKIIPVSVPCHCPLLKDAAEEYKSYLDEIDFKNPSVPVINNVDVTSYQSAQQIKEKLKEQLYSPVRWVETIQFFKRQRVDLIIECGPGKVLSGLAKRIDRSLAAISIYDTISLEQAMERFTS